MNHNVIEKQNQIINFDKLGKLSEYFAKFKIGTLLNQSGIIKTKGASPLALFTAVFNLPFVGKNLYQGIVKNKKIAVDKDAVYNFLNSSTYNWRRFSLLFFKRIYIQVKSLLDNSSITLLTLENVAVALGKKLKLQFV